MARAPAGPIGNSPRDVRDDAVGVPAENVKAPEPPRWPPKRKKITTNTFHAKVSGGTSGKRADRAPTFRRGGMVRGFASGGSVAAKMEKHDELPGEQKNDPFAKQNLKKAKGGPVAKAGRFRVGGVTKRQGGGDTPFSSAPGKDGGPSDMDKARALAGAVGQALPGAAPSALGVMNALGGSGGGGAAPARTGGLGGSDVGTVGGASDTTVGRSTLKGGGSVKK